MSRANIQKTYKLFIGGEFVRSESGHFFPVTDPKSKKVVANVARASRKDLRDAVKAARAAFKGWAGKTAYNRGQILYRIAEMLEARRAEFVQRLIENTQASKSKADAEVTVSIDRLIWYAGWADKFGQVFGTVNPVALPYFNFTVPEPTGVVGILAADELALLPLISQIAPVIVSGNTAVVIASEKYPLLALIFSEIIETSDVPGGVVNILSGFKAELTPHLAGHMDVNAIQYVGQDQKIKTELQECGIVNLKRIVTHDQPKGKIWFKDSGQSPYWIENFVEMKTTWHPVGV